MHIVGVTGHQSREGIDWKWVRRIIKSELAKRLPIQRCVSSLAAGSDQVFASVAFALHLPVLAIIPMPQYEDYFKGYSLLAYRRLRARSEVDVLPYQSDAEQSFLRAGQRVVQVSTCMFAIWDGEPAGGKGGTADIVTFALESSRSVLHINPLKRIVNIL